MAIQHFTPQQITEGLKTKKQEVFRYLYRTYGSMITGYVRKNSGNMTDAEEMVQTVMYDLWQSVEQGRYKEEGKLDRYIYQLTANSWREELRRRRNKPQTALEDLTITPKDDTNESMELATEKERMLNAMHHALDHMEEPCKNIIRLYHLQDVALQDVAVQMEYDYNNLRKRIFDCRKKLKAMVSERLKNDTPYGK